MDVDSHRFSFDFLSLAFSAGLFGGFLEPGVIIVCREGEVNEALLESCLHILCKLVTKMLKEFLTSCTVCFYK